MKAILLGGYRNSEHSEDPLGIQRVEGGQRQLDAQIHALSQLGMEVVCVLSGQHADEQLRLCPRIANTELVFDTNDHVNLASNLKAGLAATDGESCFVIPVEISPAPVPIWRALREDLRHIGFHTEHSVLQAVDTRGAPWHFGFPLLVTRKGNELIRGLSSFQSLLDPRLNYRQVIYSPEAELAPKAEAA